MRSLAMLKLYRSFSLLVNGCAFTNHAQHVPCGERSKNRHKNWFVACLKAYVVHEEGDIGHWVSVLDLAVIVDVRKGLHFRPGVLKEVLLGLGRAESLKVGR